jgi:hypothetical protein
MDDPGVVDYIDGLEHLVKRPLAHTVLKKDWYRQGQTDLFPSMSNKVHADTLPDPLLQKGIQIDLAHLHNLHARASLCQFGHSGIAKADRHDHQQQLFAFVHFALHELDDPVLTPKPFQERNLVHERIIGFVIV